MSGGTERAAVDITLNIDVYDDWIRVVDEFAERGDLDKSVTYERFFEQEDGSLLVTAGPVDMTVEPDQWWFNASSN